MRVPATPLARDGGDGAAAERRVCEFYGVETLDGFGAFTRAEVAAAALALAYVKRTQFEARPALSPPTRRARGTSLEIDPATRANLELTRTLSGARDGSLLATIDLTVTPAGARLLAERLASPLTDPEAVNRRLDSLEFLVEAAPMRDALRRALTHAPDFLRALSRLSLDRGGPRDLAAVRDGLAAAATLASILEAAQELPPEILSAYARLRADCAELGRDLEATLADDLPLIKRDGGFVRPGAMAALDEARSLRDESRRVIAGLQASYANEAGVRQLRIKHNNFLGYFIETPQAAGETLLKPPHNATFIHRQTMAGAMRFSTNALADLASRIASAADQALALELEAFERLRQACVAEGERLRGFGAALAEIDVAAALAELAVKRSWTRPLVDASLSFRIEGGRHPVVEAALKEAGEPFVANDCDLTGEAGEGGRIAIVTGPNMAGKSTYLRQNALIALIAQMGAYVPAARAHIGIVDRLFSRVGAADDLARGRSTFMVEMVETAAILNQATTRSLVILDEIGRGTATFDGLSIAYACVEHLSAVNRSRALFATHFHELTALAETLPRLVNLTMRVTEFKGALAFLHEVVHGAADRSYGIQVAKLAGLPSSVVKRARQVLASLEATRSSSSLDALPLFSYEPREPPPPPAPDEMLTALMALDPDRLSPRDALDVIYKLKTVDKGQGVTSSVCRPVLDAEPRNGAERAIMGHQRHVMLRRVSCDHQVERAERPSLAFEAGPKGRIASRRCARPGQNIDRRQKLVHCGAQPSRFRSPGDAEQHLAFCHHRKADAVRRLGFESRGEFRLTLHQSARRVGVEHEARHSSQPSKGSRSVPSCRRSPGERKSSGALPSASAAKKRSKERGFVDRITSPVAGSRRI